MFFSTDKVLVKVHPEGKFVVDIDEKNVDMKDVTPNLRVALKNDSYVLHKILPNKVDPLVSLMMVEKVIPCKATIRTSTVTTKTTITTLTMKIVTVRYQQL